MNNKRFKKAMLIILDGWGIGNDPSRSAISQANTPFMDSLIKKWPNSSLTTYGESVGLPKGQMGNSEVGHMTIGAGRVIPQELLRINRSISNGEFKNDPTLKNALQYAKENNKKIHLLGLLSDGGVHSHINHLKAICDICIEYESKNVHIHAILDGRDTSPKSGIKYIKDIEDYVQKSNIKLASVIGRYYAMDRDQRWERIKKAYDLLCHSTAEITTSDINQSMIESYKKEITDEFVLPTKIVSNNNDWEGKIEPEDVVIFFNFRTDRPRQLTQVLTQKANTEYNLVPMRLYFITMKTYHKEFNGIKTVFKDLEQKINIGSYISKIGLKQLRIAETEKYAHVTYFLSGGQEKPYKGEDRIMIPSPKVATYDLQPEMSAKKVTSEAIRHLREHQPNLVILNYANTDMVGHTGSINAAIIAAQEVDKNLEMLVNTCFDENYEIIIIADHGNSEYMINDDGTPHTAHTTNPVPCIIINHLAIVKIRDGYLYDIAPTLLKLMGIPIPESMTGKSLY